MALELELELELQGNLFFKVVGGEGSVVLIQVFVVAVAAADDAMVNGFCF